jgi:pimeloyl-ACP methyl ester carboxylesterase
VVLALGPDPVLAFLHLPPESARRTTAVLLCAPFGWADTCAHRGLRAWAIALAQAGYPALRFDLPSSGDSGGGPRSPRRLEAWTGAVSKSAAWLREQAGADRAVAVGIGLGGALACCAVAEGAPIDDLVLWAVHERVGALLREMRAYSRLAGGGSADFAEGFEGLGRGELELAGFFMTAETADALAKLELGQLEVPRAAGRRVLLLGRDRLGVDDRLREHFERSGAAVSVQDSADYGELMAEPQEARPPRQTIATTLRWLEEGHSRPGAGRASSCRGRVVEELEAMTFEQNGSLLRETPLALDGGAFAILSERAGGERSAGVGGGGVGGGGVGGAGAERSGSEFREAESAPVWALWVNGGAVRHIGPHRAWVEIARRWASRGVPTVRVDLPGIGESEGAEPDQLSDRSLYAERRTEQLLEIIDQLSQLELPDRVVVGGLCSGAYWALHAALADSRVAGTMLINLYAFRWSEQLTAERSTHASLRGLRARGWRRVVDRELDLGTLKRATANLRPDRLRASAGHPVESADARELLQALDTLRGRGTETLLLLSQDEALHRQFMSPEVLERFGREPGLTVEEIPSRDHIFRAIPLQRHVHDALDRGLERVLAAVSASGRPVPQATTDARTPGA